VLIGDNQLVVGIARGKNNRQSLDVQKK